MTSRSSAPIMSNSPPGDRLYRLLPAIYRIRDAAQGEPLRALLDILQQELQVLEADIDGLYDNWFIETCDEWIVPYIGDLLDVRELYAESNTTYGQQERRAYVANTLRYRRRKGTTPVLEQLTQDVTGWRSRVVEFGRLVSTTQNLSHIRTNSTTVSLRANNRLEEIGTPFEQQAAYSVELRPVRQGGRYNVPNIGLYIWRLQSYPLTRVQARAMSPNLQTLSDSRYYTFNPLGRDGVPLFNQPQTQTSRVSRSGEINVPAMLRRPVLAVELEERRRLCRLGEPLKGIRYFDSDPVLQIFLNGQSRPLPPESILIQSLASEEEIAWDKDTTVPPVHQVAVDPELGRLAVRGNAPNQVEVSYFYGFSADVGGGPYPRIDAVPLEVAPSQLPISPWHWSIQQTTRAVANPLADAINEWNQTVLVRDGVRRGSHIPLAVVTVPPIQVAKVVNSSAELLAPASSFKPGLVRGLHVRRGLCPTEVVVTPGLAIDRAGHPLRLQWPWSVDVAQRFEAEMKDLLQQQPIGTGVLVVFYTPKTEGTLVDFNLVPETALEGYPDGTFIPLATLRFNAQLQLLAVQPIVPKPEFQAGIVEGLAVYTRPGTLETMVTAGTAVDSDGNVVVLDGNTPLDLSPAQGTQRTVIVVPSERGDRQLQLLSQAELDQWDQETPYLELAQLDIPRVTLGAIKTHPEQMGRSLTIDIAPESLTVTPFGSILRVANGQLKLPDGTEWVLSQSQNLELSAFAGRTVLVFLSDQPDQGWPLPITSAPSNSTSNSPSNSTSNSPSNSTSNSPANAPARSALGQGDEGNAYVGVIPVIPPTDDIDDPLGLMSVVTGWMVLGDSATYRDDLEIVIPPNTCLQILASDGHRPHIQGDLTVQGWTAEQQAEGELWVNGLLVEGTVHVLAGSLGSLSFQHCTLVPLLDPPHPPQSPLTQEGSSGSGPPPWQGGARGGLGGIRVYRQTPADLCLDTEEFSLLAFMIYCLVLMWQIIGQELGLKTGAPAMTMAEFLQSMWQQLATGMSELWQSADSGAPSILPGLLGHIPADEVDNDRLKIQLESTISGPILLAETVPQLTICNSVVDKGTVTDSSAVAIAAPGTSLNIDTATVLGSTRVRQLDASTCLFTEKVTVSRHQEGCVRFSYVPIASSTPRRYRCQPDLALSQVLDEIPTAVTILSPVTFVKSGAEQSEGRILAGTAGDGIFGFPPLDLTLDLTPNNPANHLNTTANDDPVLWRDLSSNLSDRALTTIAAYRWQAGSRDDWQEEVLLGTTSGRIFKLLQPSFESLFTPITSENEAIASPPTAALDWRAVALPDTNAAITVLYPEVLDGMGTLSMNQGLNQSINQGINQGINQSINQGRHPTLITGTDTQFEREVQPGDYITVADQTIQVKRHQGTGRISSQDRTVTGYGTQFLDSQRPLKPGDTLTVERQLEIDGVFQTVTQTRTISAKGVENDTTLFITRPFKPDIASNQAVTFVININTELVVDKIGRDMVTVTAPNAMGMVAVVNESFTIHRLWAATDGGGLWQGSMDAQYWHPFAAKGLSNRKITSMIRIIQVEEQAADQAADQTAASQLWVGTAGGGVFRLDPDNYRWIPVNESLTNREVTALIANAQGQLLAATCGGIFRFDQKSEEWDLVSTGLTSGEISAIAPPLSVQGTLSIEDKVVTSIIFAGSHDGKLFRSIDDGQTWQAMDLDLRGTDINTIVVEEERKQVWLGAADGAVLRSLDYGQTWHSIHDGRPKLAQKLRIINQLQPSFTSTTYGDPGYVQLRQNGPDEIYTGAEDGAEMGVFNPLKHPQREANLRTSLDEYLRFGLEAGIFYMT